MFRSIILSCDKSLEFDLKENLSKSLLGQWIIYGIIIKISTEKYGIFSPLVFDLLLSKLSNGKIELDQSPEKFEELLMRIIERIDSKNAR